MATLPTQPAVSCVDAGLSDSCYRLNQATCSPADGIAGVACYSNAERAGDPRGVVYGHVDRTAHKMVVQYLYFYYDDLYSNDYPPDDLFWQAHEGDWEVASVVLDRRSQQPLYAAYSQHCTGERRDWATSAGSVRTRSITSRIGSHANLFDAGSHPVATQCIPPAAADPGGERPTGPVDLAGAGQSYGPGSAPVPGSRPSAGLTDGTGTRSVAFWGTWGEDHVFHAPPPIGTVTLGTSPLSPRYQATWTMPLTTFSRWPVG